MDIVQKITEEF